MFFRQLSLQNRIGMKDVIGEVLLGEIVYALYGCNIGSWEPGGPSKYFNGIHKQISIDIIMDNAVWNWSWNGEILLTGLITFMNDTSTGKSIVKFHNSYCQSTSSGDDGLSTLCLLCEDFDFNQFGYSYDD